MLDNVNENLFYILVFILTNPVIVKGTETFIYKYTHTPIPT